MNATTQEETAIFELKPAYRAHLVNVLARRAVEQAK